MNDVLLKVTDKSGAESTLIVILFIVFCVIVVIPICSIMLKNGKERRKAVTEREQLLVSLVQQNAEAMTALAKIMDDVKKLMRNQVMACDSCKDIQNAEIMRIMDGIAGIRELLVKLETKIDGREI